MVQLVRNGFLPSKNTWKTHWRCYCKYKIDWKVVMKLLSWNSWKFDTIGNNEMSVTFFLFQCDRMRWIPFRNWMDEKWKDGKLITCRTNLIVVTNVRRNYNNTSNIFIYSNKRIVNYNNYYSNKLWDKFNKFLKSLLKIILVIVHSSWS